MTTQNASPTPAWDFDGVECYLGDAIAVLDRLAPNLAHMAVFSPPYWGVRNYDVDGQLGMERTPDEYVDNLVAVMRSLRRVLRHDATVWLNVGDSYAKQPLRGDSRYFAGLKAGDLCGIPWALAMALRADGWHLRNEIIWFKTKCLPSSAKDRLTVNHEDLFLLSKERKYYFDQHSIREPHAPSTLKRIEYGLKQRHRADAGIGMPPVDTEKMGSRFAHPLGRNKRTVWTLAPDSRGGHVAPYPRKLIEPAILAGCPEGGTVIDPFFGSGTTGVVARAHGRRCIGIELSDEYADMARTRLETETS